MLLQSKCNHNLIHSAMGTKSNHFIHSAVHCASLVHVHWTAKVNATWIWRRCLRICQSHSTSEFRWPYEGGSCQWTIDLRPLNAATYHQTHLTESPLVQASRTPAGICKSCIEPRNGYNSVPLDEKYCELAMFWTPWGQCISRDAYNMCYNKVTHYTHQGQTNMLVDWVEQRHRCHYFLSRWGCSRISWLLERALSQYSGGRFTPLGAGRKLDETQEFETNWGGIGHPFLRPSPLSLSGVHWHLADQSFSLSFFTNSGWFLPHEGSLPRLLIM